MATTNKSSTEEVIEKKDASPVTVACLILAAVAIMGSIALHLAELAEYRENFTTAQAQSDDPARDRVRKDLRPFRENGDIDLILEKSAIGKVPPED